MELIISGSGVYITPWRLKEARREAKNGTQLAFWYRETLARSSLSSKSKYQYQQLDPLVIHAIQGIENDKTITLFTVDLYEILGELF